MLEANETEKVNIEADVEDEILKHQVDFDVEKKRIVSSVQFFSIVASNRDRF